jgi:thermitase
MRDWVALGIICLVACGFSAIESAERSQAFHLARYAPDQIIVGLEARAPSITYTLLSGFGEIRTEIAPIHAVVVRLEPYITVEDALSVVANLPGVRYAEPDYVVRAWADPNDPGYSMQYGLRRVQADRAWDLWNPQQTIYVAVIDTGIEYLHPDLDNKFRRHDDGSIYGIQILGGQQLPIANDDNGHGTHVAGIIAAETNNGIGVAGVAGFSPCRSDAGNFVQLMPVKVLTAPGVGLTSDVVAGMIWAVDNGAHILSMSLGGSGGSQAQLDAVNYAWNNGRLVVVAAGNDGTDAPSYPAFYPNAIAVAATDEADTLTSFSQYGSWVDIAAPGARVYSTYIGGLYMSLSGTSMACPHVSGAAALVWSHAPQLTNQQLRQLLEQNVDPYIPFSGRQIAPGAGRLNVYRALLATGHTCTVHNGDVNCDGCIDDADLLAVLFAFGTSGSNIGRMDVNCDGTVDDADLLIVLFNFGTGC